MGWVGLLFDRGGGSFDHSEVKGEMLPFDLSHQGLAMVINRRYAWSHWVPLGVLLAFGKMASPAYVPVIMSVIFAGAPIVNAIVSTTKEGNWPHVKLPFLLGIALTAVGGYLATKHAPKLPKSPPAAEVSNSTGNFGDEHPRR